MALRRGRFPAYRRTHTKHIYVKLAVTSRRAAVRRAQELDLVSRTRNRQP